MQMFHSISDLLGIQKSNPYCGVWIMNPNCVYGVLLIRTIRERVLSQCMNTSWLITASEGNEWKSWLSQRDHYSFRHRSHWRSFSVPFSKFIFHSFSQSLCHTLTFYLCTQKEEKGWSKMTFILRDCQRVLLYFCSTFKLFHYDI